MNTPQFSPLIIFMLKMGNSILPSSPQSEKLVPYNLLFAVVVIGLRKPYTKIMQVLSCMMFIEDLHCGCSMWDYNWNIYNQDQKYNTEKIWTRTELMNP
jgi:hypothetical protein